LGVLVEVWELAAQFAADDSPLDYQVLVLV
jgi:hypothetical protein